MAKTAADIEKPKAASAAVQAILDQIARMSQRGRSEKDVEMDRLQRMAETVNRELINDELIRTIGEAMDASANDLSLMPLDQTDGASANRANSPERSAAPRSNASAYASQMQAYRENA